MFSPKSLSLTLLLAMSALGAPLFISVASGADAPATEAPAAGQLDQHTLEKRANIVIKDIKIDAQSADKARPILEDQFQAMQTWHNEHNTELSKLWSDWNNARKPDSKDEAAAEKIAQQIDTVYATFKPQHDAFIGKLSAVLTPEQVEGVKDSITKKPGLERTYKAYLEMIPQFTDADKKFAHDRLAEAREQAMDCASDKERVNIFKRRKVQVEAYIDEKGYDYKKSYKAWIDRSKAKGKKSEDSPETDTAK